MFEKQAFNQDPTGMRAIHKVSQNLCFVGVVHVMCNVKATDVHPSLRGWWGLGKSLLETTSDFLV